MAKATVYFIKDITPENVVRAFDALDKPLPGKVAVKVHTGEAGNQNYLRPEFMKPMIDHVNGTVVECNTAYPGARNSTEKHRQLIHDHEWDVLFPFDLMDAEGDVRIPVPGGRILQEDIVGKDLLDYDSMLVFSHFKGHGMGGFGGALKQLSIGCSSSAGKTLIHTAGTCTEQEKMGEHFPEQDRFLESMADAAAAVVTHFEGNMAFVNVMKNISVDCDCDAHAKPPCMADMGILASTDPVAIDQACIDFVLASDDPGRDELMERVNSLHGTHTIDVAAELGIGTKDYELVTLA